jgi:hypothetical protein
LTVIATSPVRDPPGIILTILALIGVAVVMVMALKFRRSSQQGSPEDLRHVPTAAVALWIAVPPRHRQHPLSLAARPRLDRFAAAAPVAVVFCLGLTTGPI